MLSKEMKKEKKVLEKELLFFFRITKKYLQDLLK